MTLLELLTHPFLLAIAKVTALLIFAFAAALLIKKPSARATLWICAISLAPFVFALSYTPPILKVIPNQSSTQSKPAAALPKKEPEPTKGDNATWHSVAGGSLQHHDPKPPLEAAITSQAPANDTRESNHALFIFWVIVPGITIMLFPLVIAIFKLYRLDKKPASGKPLTIWNNIFSQTNKSYPLYFTSSEPCAYGIIKPKVIIPENSTAWTPSKIRATLMHEAAHLQRRDPLARFLSSLVRALFWFHPLVWLAHRQLVHAQEKSCDQSVLHDGFPAEDYAQELLAAAHNAGKTPSKALSMAKGSQLGKRISQIIHHPTNPPATMKTTLAISILTITTGFTLAVIGCVSKETAESGNKNIILSSSSTLIKGKKHYSHKYEDLKIFHLPEITFKNKGSSQAVMDPIIHYRKACEQTNEIPLPLGSMSSSGSGILNSKKSFTLSGSFTTMLDQLCAIYGMKLKVQENEFFFTETPYNPEIVSESIVVPPGFMATLRSLNPKSTPPVKNFKRLLNTPSVSLVYIAATSVCHLKGKKSEVQQIKDYLDARRSRGPRQIKVMTRLFSYPSPSTSPQLQKLIRSSSQPLSDKGRKKFLHLSNKAKSDISNLPSILAHDNESEIIEVIRYLTSPINNKAWLGYRLTTKNRRLGFCIISEITLKYNRTDGMTFGNTSHHFPRIDPKTSKITRYQKSVHLLFQNESTHIVHFPTEDNPHSYIAIKQEIIDAAGARIRLLKNRN